VRQEEQMSDYVKQLEKRNEELQENCRLLAQHNSELINDLKAYRQEIHYLNMQVNDLNQKLKNDRQYDFYNSYVPIKVPLPTFLKGP
jgi:uncharacterized coiled-coil DUF342 family protein